MTPEEVINHLKGKTIKDIKCYKYLKWDMCIDKIILDDGTIIEPTGHADECIFDFITMPNGENVSIERAE